MIDETTPLIADDGEQYAQDEVATVAVAPLYDSTPRISRTRLTFLLGSLNLCIVLAALDTTIVTTLMAHIASDLKELDNISWAAAAYTVAYSASQPLYGKFSDIIGRKRVLLFCILVFALGCQMCGISQSLSMLVAGRFVSGIGAGGMLSVSAITSSDHVSLRMRGIFQGLGNVCFGAAASLGGVVGGWLTAWGGWRLTFTAQIPLAILTMLILAVVVPNKNIGHYELMQGVHHVDHDVRRDSLERIDVMGSISLVSSLLLLMLGVTMGGNHFPWLSWPILGMVLGSLSLIIFFVWWELNKAIEPVLPIQLLMHRTVISACLTNFFGSSFMTAFLYYSPIFLQTIYRYSYQTVAHRLIANFIGASTGSLGAGLYMSHTGKYWTLGVVGSMLVVVASVLFIAVPFLPYEFGASIYYQSLTYTLSGMGYASVITVTLTALIAAVPSQFQATAASAQYMFRGAGSSIGIAAAAAIFQNTLINQLHQNVTGVGNHKVIREVTKSVDAIWEMPEKFLPAIIQSYGYASSAVFLFDLIMALIAGVFCARMHEHTLERK